MSEAQTERPTLFKNLTHVVNGKIYRTEGSTVLARTVRPVAFGYQERYLMQTEKGSYFEQVHTSLILGKLLGGAHETEEIKPLTLEQAFTCWNQTDEHLVPLVEAFSGLEEA